MSLAPAFTFPIFRGNLSAFSGQFVTPLCSALSQGLFKCSSSVIVVQSNDVGLLGAGIGAGKLIFNPSISANTISAMASSGLNGVFATSLAAGIAGAFSVIMNTCISTTTHAAVGKGTGVGRILPYSSFPFFASELQAVSINGISSAQLATAVSTGFDITMQESVVNIIIEGPFSVYPSTGVGLGKLY